MPEPGPSPLASSSQQLGLAQARAAIAALLKPIAGTQTVALDEALGRVLAADLSATIDVPAHDNSAMDGYAFAGVQLQPGVALRLRVVATVHAGTPWAGTAAAGEAVRIMTGAVMPADTDTVVPQELCRVDGDALLIDADAVRPGENLRRRGEDLARGEPALRAGQRLRAADIGLVASLGLDRVTVRRRLRVALFSTGDELREPGKPLEPGCIYDSNRASLRAALQRLGAEVIDLGLVRDDPAALKVTFEQAVAQADVVLTSGGVSGGDADHTRALLAQLGDVVFWKIAIRPGRPFAFGPLRSAGRQAWLFALPGNPVAALVGFYAIARDGLLQLAGASAAPLPLLQARCQTPIRKRPGRTEFQRGIVSQAGDGSWQVRLTGAQGSGMLSSLSQANALIVLETDRGSVAAGERVPVWLFDGLI